MRDVMTKTIPNAGDANGEHFQSAEAGAEAHLLTQNGILDYDRYQRLEHP